MNKKNKRNKKSKMNRKNSPATIKNRDISLTWNIVALPLVSEKAQTHTEYNTK